MKKTLLCLSTIALAAVCTATLAGCGAQEHHVANVNELANAISKGGEVVLDKDITLDRTLTINKKVRLNLNGKTLSEDLVWNEDGSEEKPKVITAIQVANGGDLTVIGNGKMKSDDLYLFNVDGGTGEDRTAKLTIESGNFEADLTAVQVVNGGAEITGGTFKIEPKNVTHGTKYMLNVINENRGTATITVKGGSFYGFDVSKDNNGDGAYLAEGYKVTKGENDLYTVSKK